jgi:DNA-binding CsgD family transcriptional regulator
MEYITAAEAAKKWGVVVRQVQKLLSENRIEGAKKYHRSWMIPANAEKPGDPRFEKKRTQNDLSSRLSEIIDALKNPLPRNNPEAGLDGIPNEEARLFAECYIAYMRGEYEKAIRCYHRIDSDAARLRACSTALASAVSTGDYPLYQEIESYCKGIISAGLGTIATTVAEWSLACINVSMLTPDMIPEWLKNGDFSALPLPLRQDALCIYARYLTFLKKYESALDVARTALVFDEPEHGLSYMSVYLRIQCAVACVGLGRKTDAKYYLSGVMKDCLPCGYTASLAEQLLHLGGLLEQLLEQKYPEYYDLITGQSKRILSNWISFHNRFARDNITTILDPREYQAARAVVLGESNKAIAAQFHLSVSTLENMLQIIYDKLLIEKGGSRRKKLVQYIL